MMIIQKVREHFTANPKIGVIIQIAPRRFGK